MKNWRKYKKTIAALAIGYVGWGTMVVESAPAAITATEWIALATVTLVGAGVYSWRNEV